MKKTRLAVAMLTVSLGLVGCIGDDEEQQAVTETYVGFEPVIPAGENRSPIVPFPFDAFFAGAKTPTLNIPNASNNPLVTQANLQDGYSTTASWFIDIFGMVDLSTVPANLLVINSATQKLLKYGEDYTIESSTVKDSSGVPINAQRTRLLIEPLKPLAASTTYLVALKKGVKTLDGGMVAPSYMFKLLNSDTKVTDNTDLYLKNYSAAEKATLEALRSQVIRPVVTGLKALVPENDILLAYSVTTQSTTKTLDMVAANTTASDLNVAPIGKTVQDLLDAAAVAAGKTPTTVPNANQTDVYVGTLKVPYYMSTQAAATEANPTPILNTYWKADATKPDFTASLLGKIPCGAYAAKQVINGITLEPSLSTTTCFPLPLKQSDQIIPVILTVPKGVKPTTGWPISIFQHGITRNRSDMLAIAPSLAKAGFATIAIDLPLHGLASDNPLYKNKLLAGSPAASLMTENERTFDADFVNNQTGAAGKDDKVDGSGTHFINLASPITSRDNLRQGAADILVLAKSLANLNTDGVAGGDIDTSKVTFTGISLGTIVGTVALGADNLKTIGAASLSVGGGAIPKLLDASKSYGPIIANGLKGNGVLEDTDTYETFMRFAQTLVDSGDPINFAAAAKNNHAIHFTQVLNDLVVPNAALKGDATATQDKVGATGFLSGNTALARAMGFSDKKEIDIATVTKQNLMGSSWLQFNQGTHGSLINPAAPTGDTATDAEKATFLSITTEMQCQTVSFLASGGAIVPVGCSKPAEVK